MTQERTTKPNGRALGGLARAAVLTGDERSAIARQGAEARWSGKQAAEGKTAVLSVRIRADLKARLEQPRFGPYPISITHVVERGIELALAEMEKFRNVAG